MSTLTLDPIGLLEGHSKEFRHFGVRKLGVFGSFARGEQTDSSDVDVFVEFFPGRKNFDNFSNLYFFLEDLFGRSIDLVTEESLNERKARIIMPTVRYADLNP